MSEKKLQDYIQYYIGCRCFNTWLPSDHPAYDAGWILRGYRTTYEKCYFLDNEEDETWTDSIKPILRRLESITDEEWGKIESETSMMPEAQGYQAVKDSFFNPHINYRFYWPIVNEALQILRKRNVDVDGLLDSGLAIDSATLPKIN